MANLVESEAKNLALSVLLRIARAARRAIDRLAVEGAKAKDVARARDGCDVGVLRFPDNSHRGYQFEME